MNRKLTVVIPVYNVEKYLGECVASVQAQQYPDYEIILVDDGSTDGSGAMCDRLAASTPDRIRVIHKANAGLGMARNTGIEAATGTYITFLDSDDTIHPAAYSTCIEAMERNNADQARFRDRRMTDGEATDLGQVDSNMFIYNTPQLMHRIAKVFFGQPYIGDDEYNIGGSACMAVYRLDVIRRGNLRFHSERELLSEDFVFNYDYIMASGSIVWLPREYYNYRVVPGSLTLSNFMDKMERAEEYSRYVADMLVRDGFGQESEKHAHGFCLDMLRVCLKNILTDPKLTKTEKQAWFDRYIRGGYFREICDGYPVDNMPLALKLLHRAMIGNHYRLLCLLAYAMKYKNRY